MKDKINRMSHVILSLITIQFFYFYSDIEMNAIGAIMSVVIVYQPYVGNLFLKAKTRLLATFMGIAYSFLISYLFIDNTYIYILSTLIWLFFCNIIAGLIKPENTSIFLLGGYTCAFITAPIYLHTSNIEVYHNLLYRSFGITFGVVITVIISLILFPKYLHKNSTPGSLKSIYKDIIRIKIKIKMEKEITTSQIETLIQKTIKLVSQNTLIKYEYNMSFTQSSIFDRTNNNIILYAIHSNIYRLFNINKGGIYFTLENLLLQSKLNSRKKLFLDNAKKTLYYSSSIKRPIIRAIRTMIGAFIILAIWYFTGWQGSSVMFFFAMTYIMLLSAFPNPLLHSKEITLGTILGAIVSYIYLHFIFTQPFFDANFIFYIMVQIPILIYGAYILIEPKTSLRGITFLTTFYFCYSPSNHFSPDYLHFIDNTLGVIFAMLITTFVLIFVFPEPSPKPISYSLSQYIKKISKKLKYQKDFKNKKITQDDELIQLIIHNQSNQMVANSVLNFCSFMMILSELLSYHQSDKELLILVQKVFSFWAIERSITYNQELYDQFKMFNAGTNEKEAIPELFTHFFEEIKP
ncbi:FUSC family protein [Acinetobacter modestus]|uniref:FUSC family protein n=1 Tax=Acinetobacter modestus TaxID=1776740 RepID=UPI0030197D2F